MNEPLSIQTSWQEDINYNYVLELLPPREYQGSPIKDIEITSTFGQFARFSKLSNGLFKLQRDPLGIEKLFYSLVDSQFHFSRNFTDLLKYNQPVFSAPRGAEVTISDNLQEPGLKTTTTFEPPRPICEKTWSLGDFQSRLEQRLDNIFNLIKQLEEQGYQIFIALSGGLDSSIIANLASKHLNNPISCTLDLGGTEDASQSQKIAKVLGIKNIQFEASKPEILEAIDEAPAQCQDYRDFNVHCAALNILLGKNIREWANHKAISPKRIILTGDLMNELTCDYHEELIEGTAYYRLPRIPAKKLQKHLVAGLDTSDREVTPFLNQGLLCIQPYAACFDLYLNIPENLMSGDIKPALNNFLVPPEVTHLQPKEKLRAQVGDKDSMGILGLCHLEGITQDYFMNKLLSGNLNQRHLIPIHMGRYKTQTSG